MGIRKIIRIDRDLCNGCGSCASACAEGAIEMRDGKAELVKDSYCDGLGACIGECPTGALTIEEREAPGFDEHAVKDHLERKAAVAAPACGCPSSQARSLGGAAPAPSAEAVPSQLTTWPVQITLVPPGAPFLSGADLLLAADCTPFAFADFHRRFVRGRVVLVGCPKLDDAASYVEKLAQIFAMNGIRSVEVVYMQVPCCGGLVRVAREARDRAGAAIPLRLTRIGLDGSIQESVAE
jgi:Fe-S-cluster-containing hydrogenase component 2